MRRVDQIREEIIDVLAQAKELPRVTRVECVRDTLRSLRLETVFKAYLKAKFGKETIEELDDDELRVGWQYVMTLRHLTEDSRVVPFDPRRRIPR